MGRRTKDRLVRVGLTAAHIVCISDTKTLFLANTLLWDGAATLVRNLLVSSTSAEQALGTFATAAAAATAAAVAAAAAAAPMASS
jgi:hypothetical protein